MFEQIGTFTWTDIMGLIGVVIYLKLFSITGEYYSWQRLSLSIISHGRSNMCSDQCHHKFQSLFPCYSSGLYSH